MPENRTGILSVNKKNLKNLWERLRKSPRAAQIAKFLKKAMIVAIFGLIIYQLMDIGWKDVLTSLPVQPLYYLLFFLMYISLPTAEVAIYKQVWNFPSWEGFKIFLKKKVYNNEVMGYTGELYLFMWGRKLAGNTEKSVLKDIRDNSILSAVTSNLIAVLLVGIIIYAGQVQILDVLDSVNWIYVLTGVFIALIVIGLIIQFRKYLFDLAPRKAAKIFCIYLTRFVIHHGLMVLSWAVVIPDTSITIWLTFLATVIVVNRIPFIPSKDLVFVWFGIELSKMLDVATASVAGMLLVYSALSKVTNLILFTTLSLQKEADSLKTDRNKDSSRVEAKA